MAEQIPFNRPCFVGNELEFISEAIANGNISGGGPFSQRCEKLLEEELGVPEVLLTSSCTHALEMAALLLDPQQGDEVIVPSFAFVSTVNAFVLHGAKPVFADVRPDTLNIDEAGLESLITPRTKACVPIHYAGVGCNMDALLMAADRYGFHLVEDNAHGLFAKYKGRNLGTFGTFGALSFHETKNITCGEGGALLLNDESYKTRAEIIREKGTNRAQFFRNQVDKYTWLDIGSSYLLSDVSAAFLYAQLKARDAIGEKRKRLWNKYFTSLTDWAAAREIRLPVVGSDCEQSYHMFYMLLASLEERSDLIRYLRDRGILSVFHYLPLHLSPMGRKYGGHVGQCPVAEDVSDRLLRLPFYNDMSADEQDRVIDALLGWH